MKSDSHYLSSVRDWVVVVVLVLIACHVQGAQTKPIRLRNQTIVPATAKNVAPAKSAASLTVSGLYILQFSGPLSDAERVQLSAAGVDLLHYVPEDAFLARAENSSLAQLRSLPFVQWIGEYRPEHKIHRTLTSEAKAKTSGQLMDVTVLLAPRVGLAKSADVRQLFASVQQTSTLHSGTILRGQIDPAQLDLLTRSDSVLWIEPFHKMKLVDEIASKIVAGDGGSHELFTQSLGYDGAGVKVAVADSGLNNGDAATMHPDLFGRTPAFFYYGALTDAADEHSHGTHVAGIIGGNGATGEVDDDGNLWGLGVAPGASIIAQRIFDGVGNYEPPANGFPQLTKDATDAGAVIGSNSWGDDTQGRYDTSAMEFDALVRDATGSGTNNRPYILEFSAGNAGPGEATMDSPAVAKNVLATGACQNDRPDLLIYGDGPDFMADFSSRGPCEDGRIKPDVIAPGTWISSLQSASATDQYAWAAIDSFYQFQGGTSQAGPHASGAAAVFVQYWRETHTNATPSPALVKAALINSAYDIATAGPGPNMDAGWGLLDLTIFFDPTFSFQFVDQSVLLTNSGFFERRVFVGSRSEPFKITLAYTDVPGFPGSVIALVNDLDLEVVGPDGTLYRGNRFNDEGESIPNSSGPDVINNVEGVLLNTPSPGEYIVRVRGRHIVQDALGSPGTPRQDFALAISGVIPEPGVGTLILDRGAYSAPSQIKITLLDTDLAGQASANVLILSTNEPLGENLSVKASGTGGVFTGALATATGPAVAHDGILQITNNDPITVAYFDASASANRYVSTHGDLVAPTLSGVSVSFGFGQATIAWTSGEPANSTVRFGTNNSTAALTTVITNSELVTAHSVVLGSLVPGRTYYYLVASADDAGNASTNNNNGALFSFVAPPVAPVLLVDEYQDPYFSAPPISGYTDALNALGISYDLWDVSAQPHPPLLSDLQPYRAVIWRVPELVGAWTTAERSGISNYLHSGGSLFVASMELLSRLEENGGSNFIHSVLQVQSYIVDPDSSGAAEIIGAPNESIGKDLDIVMDYTAYDNVWGGLLGPDLSDTITPNTNATTVLRNDVGDIVGLRWPAIGQAAPGRLVFLTFPFDAVPINSGAGAGVNDRINLLRNVLSFLAPGASGLGSISLDSPAYTAPGLVTLEVGDFNLAGHGTLNVTAFTTSQTNPITVTLQETVNKGIFIGSFALVTTNNSPTPGRLLAKNGDTIQVKYFDVSANSVLSATALVDTVPAIITGVSADPDYEEATISWNTSEAADSLVQFGESPLLNRTGYDANPTTSHGVTIVALQPDRTYYYQVVSRDIAGNTTVDDNHGHLYTIHTLQPLSPPWFDSIGASSTNWSTYSADNSQVEWTIGVPDNGDETSAHSPPNAWGSNLKGGAIDYTETFLISPAIDLTGGNSATLRFWHAYDFSTDNDLDVLEYGALLVVTNGNAGSPITLAEYSDDFTTWSEEEIDLTPYVGHVVYLVWDYELLSFESRPRPGWLVDDVSVTVSNSPTGTIQVSNNIWQAAFTFSGSSLTGTGRGTTFTNAPVGQYVINFTPVPYYQTPLPQTNTLTVGGNLLFQGNYTIPDINGNGISDLWEQAFFGVVTTNRTRSTDSDGDGMTDYAEFIAGTNPDGPVTAVKLSITRISNTSYRLSWPCSPGQLFQVLVSTNLTAWTAYADWFQSTGSVSTVTVASANPRSYFKVQSAALNQSSTAAGVFRVSAQKQPNGAVSLNWTSAIGHGYQVDGTTNGLVWSPVSSWLRAATTNTSYTLPASTPGAPFMFRVQVQP